MCESYGVQLRPAVDVLVSAQQAKLSNNYKNARIKLLETSIHNKHIDSRSQLNTVRLTHNTRHAATAPN